MRIAAAIPRDDEDAYSERDPNPAAQLADEGLDLLRIVVDRRRLAPHGLRPGDVARASGDDVHMQLRHDIAERGDVELVAGGDRLERAGDAGDFGHQLRLLDLVEIDDLDGVAAGNEQHPGIVRVLDHEHARQRQIADSDRILLELRMQRPAGL